MPRLKAVATVLCSTSDCRASEGKSPLLPADRECSNQHSSGRFHGPTRRHRPRSLTNLVLPAAPRLCLFPDCGAGGRYVVSISPPFGNWVRSIRKAPMSMARWSLFALDFRQARSVGFADRLRVGLRAFSVGSWLCLADTLGNDESACFAPWSEPTRRFTKLSNP
jgi:hypothetical protein